MLKTRKWLDLIEMVTAISALAAIGFDVTAIDLEVTRDPKLTFVSGRFQASR